MYVDMDRALDASALAAAVALVTAEVDTALLPGPGGARITRVRDDVEARLRSIIGDALPDGRWTNAAIVALYPSQQINGHVDAPPQGIRYHVPLRVNPGCWVFHGGEWRQPELGRVYRMDPTDVHGAVNWGDSVRWHLLVDLERA